MFYFCSFSNKLDLFNPTWSITITTTTSTFVMVLLP
jgi:hypothetical protein